MIKCLTSRSVRCRVQRRYGWNSVTPSVNEAVKGEKMRRKYGKVNFFVIVGIIAIAIAVIKMGVGKVTGNEKLKNTTMQGETKKVMDKTAKGNKLDGTAWEQSKKDAEGLKKKITHD